MPVDLREHVSGSLDLKYDGVYVVIISKDGALDVYSAHSVRGSRQLTNEIRRFVSSRAAIHWHTWSEFVSEEFASNLSRMSLHQYRADRLLGPDDGSIVAVYT